MEILASTVGALLAEPCRALFTFLRTKLKNPFHFSANLRHLDAEMRVLNRRRRQLSQRLKLVTEAGLQEPSGVREWRGKVDTLDARWRSLKQDLDSSARNSERSCCLRCSRLSDHVAIRLGEARQLTSDWETLDVMNIGRDPSIVTTEHMPAPAIEDQATAKRNMAKVMDLLRREDVPRIGIWGMGGVGKTNLVQNINNKLSGSDSFSIIMWITVSNRYQETESALKKVQNLIAKRFKRELPEESIETRTSQLRARLMMEKAFLLILDDVWNPIDLDRVGIPEPQVLRGSKIILTTRSSDVCSQMDAFPLKIEALNEDEAWSLFCKSAGVVATLKEIEPLAKAITKECGGLPLAINVVGASLKGKTVVEVWKDALNALRRSEPPIGSRLEDKVYNPIKWSYDLLPDECIKSCFLFCCLFLEDYEIVENTLIRYWLAEGLLEDQHDIEKVMSRGITIIQTLKDRSLLEESSSVSCVKIHDIIRDVSIWISSLPENECISLVRSGIGLEEMREDELSVKSYNRVSFMGNEIRELPNALEECPTVTTLLLQENRKLKHIPDDFLPAFKSLKILDLSHCSIKSLPPCLGQLVELRALVLISCHNLETLPPVGGLAKLQVFVCSGTGISTLPQGMEKLTNLRQLDLSSNHKLTVIPVGLVSSLSNLEELYLCGNGQLKFIGESGEIVAQLREIMSLKRLSYLTIGLGRSASTLETTDSLLNWMKKLNRFDFVIGEPKFVNPWPRRISNKSVFFNYIHLWGEWIEWLFANTNYICFEGCEGLDTLFQKLVANGDEVGCFDTVKSLLIQTYSGSFEVRSNAKLEMLPNLEEILLYNVTNLSCASTLASQLGLKFSKLRSIYVEECPQLKYLISLGTTILSLEKLEGITIDSCELVEQLFKFDHQNSSLQDCLFPNLKRIKLSNCPRLGFVTEQNNVACPRLEEVSVWKCPLLKKLPITLQNVGTIKKINGEQEWWDQLEWENDDIKNALHPSFNPHCCPVLTYYTRNNHRFEAQCRQRFWLRPGHLLLHVEPAELQHFGEVSREELHASHQGWHDEGETSSRLHASLKNDIDAYRKGCKFLPKLNNEIYKNSTYKERFSSLENLVLIKFEKDDILVPKETSWFGYFPDGSWDTVLPAQETTLYTEDWIGLKILDEAGKVKFVSVSGGHLEISYSEMKKYILPYLVENANVQARLSESSHSWSWSGHQTQTQTRTLKLYASH
ncbi:UNVERIFIED_CONTAM: Disease resistance protein [Sesamum calycinum]|uniref:Disease resistance protein n=1 Tax=Sesamum calycinum TaxID=2727403 RepID=A0AAW2SZ59_9LAMI